MSHHPDKKSKTKRFTPLGIIFAVLGLLLFAYFVRRAGVEEVYVTLYFISDVPPTLLTAFVLESVNRIINVVFKFVPMRVGVDEAGTARFTAALNFGATAGVTLAI